MALIYWLPEFETNIRIIDEQHRHLVDLVNQLYEAHNSGKDRTVLLKIINKLGMYTAMHFAREEDLFETYNYLQIEEHIQEHEYFEDMLNTFENEFKLGKQELTNTVISFLADWLIDHFNDSDQAYVIFLKSRGVS